MCWPVLIRIAKGSVRIPLIQLSFCALIFNSLAAADPNPRQEPMTVRIVAISASTRALFAGNEDSYIASVTDSKGRQRIVRLADWFPGYVQDFSGMELGSTYRISGIRTPWCDSNARTIFVVRSIQPLSEIFANVEADDLKGISCYRIQHRHSKRLRPTTR